MLISQFDKFVNRSTHEILGSEIERENLEPMLSTDIPRSAGNVTGVKGEKEVYYRTGNVNLTPADLGALDNNNVYNGLDETEEGYALDARQGKVLNEGINDKLDKDNVYNGLDQTEAGYALDARQGKVLNEGINDKLDKDNVYNGLDQTEAGYALDARQGKVLADKLTDSGWIVANETYPTYVRYKNGYATIIFRLDGDPIPLNGELLYTVPVPYRPLYDCTVPMQNMRGNLLVKPDGSVTVNAASGQTFNSYMGTLITYPY